MRMRENYRMAQTTKWLPAILDYMNNVMSSISTCLAQFPNGCLYSVNWNSGMEWNSGMVYWNSGMPINERPIPSDDGMREVIGKAARVKDIPRWLLGTNVVGESTIIFATHCVRASGIAIHPLP